MVPKLRTVDHIHVFVANRNEAREWYAQVLGMTPIPTLEFWAADGGPLTIADAGGTIHLALFESPKQSCRSTIAFEAGAAEFVAWKQHLGASLAREIEVADHRVAWSIYFADPDGNPYEITSYEYEDTRAGLLDV